MDILIRIIIAVGLSIALPFIGDILYEDMSKFKELNKKEKITTLLFYVFIGNLFIITPSFIIMECFKYLVKWGLINSPHFFAYVFV